MRERAPNQTHLEPLFEPGVTVHGWGLWRRASESRPYATYAAYAPATAALLSRVLRGLKELV
ncbi:hypothetical protein QR77_15320 [Streptomyces sp. 150FB]|jgi:hypothetical protein|uniref:hypothetical protein n=1 Tax=Streptomyces sp. 150FB TaxID=1576605 RepID=UPI00058949B2|nr:hypothetical protein [Streptomyces sp. 150FB]KIF74954.1 hypothetical protein QR77_15320 [Streptomyces sp. 150FB]